MSFLDQIRSILLRTLSLRKADRLLYSRSQIKAILGWIRPALVAKAAKDFAEDSEQSVSSCYVGIFTPHSFDAEQSIIFDVISQFLEDFHIPEDLLAFCLRTYPSHFTDLSIRKIRTLQFSGDMVKTNKIPDYPEDFRQALERNETKFLIGLNAPWIEFRLLQIPLETLVNQVAWLTHYWQNLTASYGPTDIHHDHNMETSFLTALDADVAFRAGFINVGRGAMKSPQCRLHTVFGGKAMMLNHSFTEDERLAFSLTRKLFHRDE